METILAFVSILACLIGVATFVIGMTARAKNDGILIGRIEHVCKKVDEISVELKVTEKARIGNEIETARQAEQISTLFKNQERLQDKVEVLEERMNKIEQR